MRSWRVDSSPYGIAMRSIGRMLLDVQAVAQAQRAELVLVQLALEETARLVAELRDPFGHEGGVDFVVAVHGAAL